MASVKLFLLLRTVKATSNLLFLMQKYTRILQ